MNHCQRASSHQEGQGKLRGKQHRSNRCEASAAWKDDHLHRREERPIGLTRIFRELLSRDHEDGHTTGQPQGVGPESYLKWYVAGADTRGRTEGRPYPWSQ